MEISIIGRPGIACIADEAIVEQLLAMEPVSFSHRGVFTGKPETCIYSDGKLVLKMNRNRSFPSGSVAEQWCRSQLAKEEEYAVYHPARIWVVLQIEGEWLVANLTPYMTALHQVDFTALSSLERMSLLERLLGCYVDFLSRFNLKLDDGLSNFALFEGELYYLDDDIYPWDHFTAFTAMLGHWLRLSASLGLDEGAWKQLGRVLKPLLRTYSSDAGDMVCEGLKDQIVGRSESLKESFLDTLCPRSVSVAAARAEGQLVSGEAIAVLADIHANLPAFEAILQAIDARGISRYLLLGDVVGYGPNPKACIDLVREREMYCLRGNHDHYVAYAGDVRVAMGIMARRTADWTIGVLDEVDRRWLAELPVRYRGDNWMAVHGAPVDKSFFNAYVYDMTAERNLDWLVEHEMPICFHGHSHIQGGYVRMGGESMPVLAEDGVLRTSEMEVALVCPGSVGQARVGRPEAQAAIYYPDDRRVELLAVKYDTGRLIEDMKRQAFPEELIRRIRQGV